MELNYETLPLHPRNPLIPCLQSMARLLQSLEFRVFWSRQHKSGEIAGKKTNEIKVDGAQGRHPNYPLSYCIQIGYLFR